MVVSKKEITVNRSYNISSHSKTVPAGSTDLYTKTDGNLYKKNSTTEARILDNINDINFINNKFQFGESSNNPELTLKNSKATVEDTIFQLSAEDKDGAATGLEISMPGSVSNLFTMNGSTAKIDAKNTNLVLQANGTNTININNGKTGFNNVTAINTVCINGNLGVGAGYAGSSTVPANSLAVQLKLGVATSNPLTTLHSKGGVAFKHENKYNEDYTVTTNDFCISAGDGDTITLIEFGATDTQNQIYIIKNIDSSGTLTVNTSGTSKIDGQDSITLGGNEVVTVMWFGTNWRIIGN